VELANISESNFAELLNGQRQQNFIDQSKNLVEECRQCEYFYGAVEGAAGCVNPSLIDNPSRFK